jgi:hypothetical protein
MLKRQSMKPVTDYIHMSFVDPESYREQFAGFSRSIIASRVGIDYKSRKFIDENGTINPDGSVRPHQVLIRCDNGTAYDFMPNRGWEPPDPGWNSKSCAERMQPDKFVSNAFTADGVATGGLSADEADKFISYLDHINGLLTMQQPQAVRGSDGKTYIQLDVTLKPQDPQLPDNAEKLTASGPFFEAAFAQTGKEPSSYPYDFGNGSTVGRQMRYYIDPSTLLPAYSVMMATPPITTDGSPASAANSDAGRYTLYEYSFPEQLDPQAMKASGTPVMPFRRWPFPITLFG